MPPRRRAAAKRARLSAGEDAKSVGVELQSGRPSLLHLPDELLLFLFRYVDGRDVGRIACVSRRLAALALDDELWFHQLARLLVTSPEKLCKPTWQSWRARWRQFGRFPSRMVDAGPETGGPFADAKWHLSQCITIGSSVFATHNDSYEIHEMTGSARFELRHSKPIPQTDHEMPFRTVTVKGAVGDKVWVSLSGDGLVILDQHLNEVGRYKAARGLSSFHPFLLAGRFMCPLPDGTVVWLDADDAHIDDNLWREVRGASDCLAYLTRRRDRGVFLADAFLAPNGQLLRKTPQNRKKAKSMRARSKPKPKPKRKPRPEPTETEQLSLHRLLPDLTEVVDTVFAQPSVLAERTLLALGADLLISSLLWDEDHTILKKIEVLSPRFNGRTLLDVNMNIGFGSRRYLATPDLLYVLMLEHLKPKQALHLFCFNRLGSLLWHGSHAVDRDCFTDLVCLPDGSLAVEWKTYSGLTGVHRLLFS